jgi:hypothetical protein
MTMTTMTVRLAFAILATACGGSNKPDPTPAPTPTQVSAPTTVQLELGELKLVDVGKNEAVLVRANGEIVIGGVAAAKVTVDGKIVNMKGEVGFTLLPDGTINGPDGAPMLLTLSPDAVIKSGDKSISVDAKGELVGANPDAPKMRVEGAATPGLKRTALFVLVALLEPGDASDAPATSGTPK